MDIADVRRRLRAAIEATRREAAARRAHVDAAARDYETFLVERAVPVFRDVANALAGEGHPFKVFTPAGAVRLASDHAASDFIELELDTTEDPPQVLGRSSRGRGRRMVTSERPVREGVAVGDLTEEDVLAFLLSEVAHFVVR